MACYDSITILVNASSPIWVWFKEDYSWIFFPVPYVIGIFSVTCSEYLLVLLSLHRYFAFCYPQIAERFCSRGKIKIYIVSIIIFSVIAVIPHCFGMAWVHSLDGSIKVVLTDFACGKTFQKFYLSGFTLLYRWIVPSICLVFTNFKVYRKVMVLSMFPIEVCPCLLMSYLNNFDCQIYPTYSPVLFMVRNFYPSNLPVLFLAKS